MEAPMKPNSVEDRTREPIAVVGMACRLPGKSNSPHELWSFLEKGGCAAAGAPESRFNFDKHFDGSRKPNTLRSPGAMFLENIDLQKFDAQFFSISRKEAVAMDPQQRQLLEVVFECLENAGITLDGLSGAPVGCFVASSTNDYRDIHARDPEDRPPNATVGLVPAILSNRISHFLNIKGPSMTIDTACSASLVSLDVANKYLQTGEIHTAIVAGCHLYLSPEANMDAGAMREAFSPSGKCHTFDAKADGYMKAEGINAVLLKRLGDAVRDGDPIRAVIRGSATNSDGRTPGIANPSSEAQAAAIRAAYANAGIKDIASTSYLEAHGTGTQAGDPVEVEAASAVLCGARHGAPLIIGSIKGNIGHSECSAGISGLIKAILAMEKGVIPGNPTFITPNPKIDFTRLKVRASRAPLPWPKVPVRRASVNSFGFGGSNCHVVLEEATHWAKSNYVSSFQQLDLLEDFFTEEKSTDNTTFLLPFSANDENSLSSYVTALRKHLLNPAVRVNLADLAFTLSERRTHHFHRGYIMTKQTVLDSNALVSGKKTADPPKIAFVFTGQGAQWPQMGKLLVEGFPLATTILQKLDKVLQQTSKPPNWSLIGELIEVREAETLRRPALSQPLVTALQLVLVEVLRSWGIMPQAVVGHSSGEIAAAYCAGLISIENAIKAAFYRGQASENVQTQQDTQFGMLAVGLGSDLALEYINKFQASPVEVACYNSPNSVTLSGQVNDLEKIKVALERDGHFARMLRVDLAYHSSYMRDISAAYKSLLDDDFQSHRPGASQIRMFSSTRGKELNEATDAEYWQTNMDSPVLFDQAIRQMTFGRDGANFLLEIGPSGTLNGPISEIKRTLPGEGVSMQYCTTFHRGQRNLDSLFEVAGKLFILGADIDMAKVNERSDHIPSVIIDLPNYQWNHAARYWHESEASKDWRFRLFPHHDLIGSKVLGTSYYAPVWKKALKVDDVSWLKDHKLGSDIVVPGAAMVVMAVEAMAQLSEALSIIENRALPNPPCYRVRNATFSRALVLEEGVARNVMLALTPRSGSKQWHDFRIYSLVDGSYIEHSRGLVRVEQDRQIRASRETLSPLVNSTPGVLWYQAMENVGYALGPAFQKHLEAESLSGTRTSRSIVSLAEPPSSYAQSRYQMHPTSVDGILQACAPALWNGNRTNINAVIIPAIIDDILICSQPESTVNGVAVVSSEYSGLGDKKDAKNFTADVNVYDSQSGIQLFQLQKLRTEVLNTHDISLSDPTFCQLSWKPDIRLCSQSDISASIDLSDARDTGWAAIKGTIDLIVFKKPALNVLEVVMVLDDPSSIWLDTNSNDSGLRSACELFRFTTIDAKSLLMAQEKYATSAAEFALFEKGSADAMFDLIILRIDSSSAKVSSAVLSDFYSMLRETGQVLLLEQNDTSQNGIAAVESENLHLWIKSNFNCISEVPFTASSSFKSAFLADQIVDRSSKNLSRTVHVLHFSSISDIEKQIMLQLGNLGWSILQHCYPFDDLSFDGTVLVLQDLHSPLLSTVTEGQWVALRDLSNSKSKILWVTDGCQFEVTKPEKAMINGLARTMRDEDPSVNFTTLDVELSCKETAIMAIHTMLESLQNSTFQSSADYEFVERQGVIHISRVIPDLEVTNFARAERHGAEPTLKPFRDENSRIQLNCERVGSVDSLRFVEASPADVSLGAGEVEIEIMASGLNFKDIAISTGLIAGNQRLLGYEGAGTIKRSASSLYRTGQRVLFIKPGSFANRIVVETDLVHSLPDSISFDEAATLGAVFPVAIYSLFDLAGLRKGQRVLIHSAAGGLGIACIQLCQYVKAEIYATVGNDEKRSHLIDTYGISPSRIFNSRSTLFATQLLNATNGEGCDVIINSLAGELLEETWRCIKDGGTMVELGKRDILERNYLPMEPFSRNVSYRSFDISHKSVANSVLSGLLKQLFKLFEEGHIKPIRPMTTFSFDDITSAFRYMQLGKHMGKIVVSSEAQPETKVPVRPALKTISLRSDRAYLIVGGLKGLCGSMALRLARHGAKHLVIMGRSGFEDDASQTVIQNILAEGCKINLIKGDVTVEKDVRRAFKSAEVPIGGLFQGAMVVRGKLYQAMTAEDFHVAVACKVLGTWNLHRVALDEAPPLDFFSLLSSTSGIAGQSGQANYVAGNAFLDAFAIYRRRLGLRANSVALGPLWDVGYMARNSSTLPKTNTSTFTTITEAEFHKIVEYSILQQTDTINATSASHLITGMAIPLRESSTLRVDARFAPLFGTSNSRASIGNDGSRELQVFKILFQSQADEAQLLDAMIELIGQQLMISLRSDEPIEPAKPLDAAGVESLAAVELRNWTRLELQVDVTMLEILNATSLIALCEKILAKMQSGNK